MTAPATYTNGLVKPHTSRLKSGCLRHGRLYFRVELAFVDAQLPIREDQRLLLPSEAMSLNDRVVDIPTIHATVSLGPHVSDGSIKIQKMVIHHEAVAA
ncbi:MAG: hypothetical protein H8K03_07375 [Nitrospira sp.]